MRYIFLGLCLILFILFNGNVGEPLSAETFYLTNGGIIEGTLLNSKELPRKQYEIQLSEGTTLTLDAKSVQTVTSPQTKHQDELTYLALAPFQEDTVAKHLGLAEWCSNHYLKNYATLHWQRVLTLDPENETAHRRLGHIRERGVWVDVEGKNTNNGLIPYKGGWKLPQEKWIDEYKENLIKTALEWQQRIGELRVGFSNSQTVREFKAITAPEAVPALAVLLHKEPDPSVRRIIIDVLGNIATQPAMDVLVARAMNDPAPDIQTACLDAIRSNSQAAEYGGTIFARLLQSDDPATINRGAATIGYLGAKEQIPLLVERLITFHQRTRQLGSEGSNARMDKTTGNVGFSAGTTIVTENFTSKNTDVLSALKRLTGVDFGYDQRAWIDWMQRQYQPYKISARRG